MPEFTPWPKTPRLFRDMVITEKLDGTNAAIRIEAGVGVDAERTDSVAEVAPGYTVWAQSRTRFVVPDDDNHGFAMWVALNADTLVADLGVGIHFGEWWGQGINRGYGLKEKRFSLFNVAKWQDARDTFTTPSLGVVPVLAREEFDTDVIAETVTYLRTCGSVAAPGFRNPEGICVYHVPSRKVFKYTLNGDGYKG